MSKVTLSCELSMSAEAACALARKPALFRYVVWPIIRVPNLDLPPQIEPGAQGSARLWWFGVIPTWKHHLKLVRADTTEIYTNEWGGPVRTWNHRLTFTPLTDDRCRYTDEVETEGGIRGLPTRVFVRVMFRYRHRRWQTLARVLG